MPKESLSHQYRHTKGAPAPFQKPSKGSLRSIIILVSVFGTIWLFCSGPVEAMRQIGSSTSEHAPSPTITQMIKATLTKTVFSTQTQMPSTPTTNFTPINTLTNTTTITPTVRPTITLQIVGNFPCVNTLGKREEAQLVRVTDGDTIVVKVNGTEYKVRYIGVDSPESGAKYYKDATNYNMNLLGSGSLVMIKDNSEVDRYDRLLRYVFANGKFVNYEMVKTGYAQSGSWPPDTSCDSTFASAMATAKTNHLGMWYIAPLLLATAPPRSTTYPPAATNPPVVIVPTTAPPASGGGCDPSYPSVCIPPPPPDLDCKDIPYRRFQVLPPDPHGFDRDGDGIGCES